MRDDYYDRNTTSPVAAGILGAIAGAAVGIGAAMLLSDPENRKKVEKKFQDMQKWGNKTLQELKDKSLEAEQRVKDEAMTTAADKAEKLQKELDDAAKQAQAMK